MYSIHYNDRGGLTRALFVVSLSLHVRPGRRRQRMNAAYDVDVTSASVTLGMTQSQYSSIVYRLTNHNSKQAREEERVQQLTMMLFGEMYKLCDITLLGLHYEPN